MKQTMIRVWVQEVFVGCQNHICGMCIIKAVSYYHINYCGTSAVHGFDLAHAPILIMHCVVSAINRECMTVLF